MTRFCVLQILLYSAAISVTEAQAPPVPQTPQNIVTVNFSEAVIQTAEAQRDLSALQAKLAPRQTALKALNDDVEALRKQIDSESDKLSDAERAMRTRSLDSKEKQLQRELEDFRNDSQTESQQAFQRVAQKVYAFLQAYSQQHGFSAVIERGSDAAPIVWYAGANMDITNELIKAYDVQAGVPPVSNDSSHRSPARSPTPKPDGSSARP